jgi:hypothetical protein
MVQGEDTEPNVGVILETDADRSLEKATIERILTIASEGTFAIQLPPLSAVDYLLVKDHTATHALEIKTRKESAAQVRGYGGLMLKHRKVLELQQIKNLMQVFTIVVFAFENARGEIYICDVATITGLEPQAPPRRRNYRGLACDEEPVVFLEWDTHVRRVM